MGKSRSEPACLCVGRLQGSTRSALSASRGPGGKQRQPGLLLNPVISRQPLGVFCMLWYIQPEVETAVWSWRIMLECSAAISFYTEFTDEEPEAGRAEGLVLWVEQEGQDEWWERVRA